MAMAKPTTEPARPTTSKADGSRPAANSTSTSSSRQPPPRMSERFALSSSPPEILEEKTVSKGRQGKGHPSSDEVEEEIEDRNGVKSTVEVLVSRGLSRTKRERDRNASPDPLDSIPSRLSAKAPNTNSSAATKSIHAKGDHVAGPSSMTSTSQQSTANGDPNRRVSRRVADANAKKEAEKEERRRKRRLEKEAAARKTEEAQRKAEGRHEPERKTREERQEAREQRNASERSDVEAVKVTKKTKTEAEAKRHHTNRAAAQDPDADTASKTKSRPSVQGSQPTTKGKQDRKRKRVISDDEHEEPEASTVDPEPIITNPQRSSSREATKMKGKVRQVSEDGDAEAEEDHDLESRQGDELPESGDGGHHKPSQPAQPPELGSKPAPAASETRPTPIGVVRPPLATVPSHPNAPTAALSHRPSPGPSNRPGGIKWKTARNDLASVLSKFSPARPAGMSKRLRITSLHTTIGPPAKALPPPPPKPVKKKKGEESEEEEDEDGDGGSDGESGDEGRPKKKKGKGMEWYMVED